MARTVIALSRAGDRVQATLERAPLEFAFDAVDLDLTSVHGVGLVERGGELTALLKSRDPVKAGFEALLSHPVGSEPAPLYFHIRSPIADAVAWEALHALPIGFLALDERCPVGRIAERVGTVQGRPFRGPLKVAAVLSAAGRDGRPQLQALRDAVAGAGIPAELSVISGDQNLVDELAGTEVRAELIAADAGALCRQLAAVRPHIIHLLCHGRTRAGVASLAFASIADVDAGGAELGSINVSVAQLVAELQGVNPWLVVLAACQTGAVGDEAGARPFAHELVHAGLTAAIGMRRLVELRDTDRFCKLLYPGVLAAIRKAVDPQGLGEQTLDWAAALTAPRQAMSGADPAGADAWTDPVLYAQSEELRVFVEGGAAESTRTAEEAARLQGRLDEYRGFLERQDRAHTDPALVAQLEAAIAQMQRELGGKDT